MKYLKKYLLFVFVAFALKANAQNYFNKVYGINGYQGSTSVIEDNGYLVIGQEVSTNYRSLFFIKTDLNGDTVWTKNYQKIQYGYYTGLSNSLIKTIDNKNAFGGTIINLQDTSNAGNFLLVKLDNNGDTLWTNNYGGAGLDNANVVMQCADSGYVLIGSTNSYGNGQSDFFMVKTDKDGNFQWQKTYGTTLSEECVSGQITLDGGFILSGSKSISSTTSNFYIVKTDFMGNLQWQKSYTTSNGICFIKQLADSSFILTGAQSITGMGYQGTILKVNKQGTFIWQKNYGSTIDDWLYSVAIILNDGSIIVSGQTTNGGIPYGTLLKTDSSGNQQWLRTYYKNPSIDNYFYDVKQASDNGFIICGQAYSTLTDCWLVKVDSNGCEVANCNVGINEFKNEKLKLHLFPNPASNEITVELSNSENTDYVFEIRNVLGELQKMEIQNSLINISQLISGIYFITAISKDGKIRVVEKFVKE